MAPNALARFVPAYSLIWLRTPDCSKRWEVRLPWRWWPPLCGGGGGYKNMRRNKLKERWYYQQSPCRKFPSLEKITLLVLFWKCMPLPWAGFIIQPFATPSTSHPILDLPSPSQKPVLDDNHIHGGGGRGGYWASYHNRCERLRPDTTLFFISHCYVYQIISMYDGASRLLSAPKSTLISLTL